MKPARSRTWFFCATFVALTARGGPAQGETQAPPLPAQLQATPLANATLSSAEWALPSPALTHALLPPECGANETVLRFLQVQTGELRQERLPGRVQALSWLDERRFLFVRTLGQAALLEVFDTSGKTGESPIQSLLPLPLAAEAPWARRGPAHACDDGYQLHVERAAEGARLALVLRRSDTRFEVHRALLSTAGDAVALGARGVDVAGMDSSPPRHRLWQVIPSLRSHRMVALWLNQPGQVPAKQVDLIDPALGPIVTEANVRTIAQVNEDLAGCSFAAEERLLCHTRSGDERGWLWAVDTAQSGPLRLRQFTHSSGAAAYALSPEGDRLAYVGTGGAEGPVTIQDLAGTTQTQLPLQAGCSGAAVRPQIFWGRGGHLLARGACGTAWHLLTPAAAPMVATAAKASPAPQNQRTSKAQKPARRAVFWSPRY